MSVYQMSVYQKLFLGQSVQLCDLSKVCKAEQSVLQSDLSNSTDKSIFSESGISSVAEFV